MQRVSCGVIIKSTHFLAAFAFSAAALRARYLAFASSTTLSLSLLFSASVWVVGPVLDDQWIGVHGGDVFQNVWKPGDVFGLDVVEVLGPDIVHQRVQLQVRHGDASGEQEPVARFREFRVEVVHVLEHSTLRVLQTFGLLQLVVGVGWGLEQDLVRHRAHLVNLHRFFRVGGVQSTDLSGPAIYGLTLREFLAVD